MKNKKHNVSPSFIGALVLFIGLLSYLCYSVASQTGLIPNKDTSDLSVVKVDTNQIKLNQKDSIILLRDQEIVKLKQELSEGPDTVYLKPKPVIKKSDTTSLSISKVDSVK